MASSAEKKLDAAKNPEVHEQSNVEDEKLRLGILDKSVQVDVQQLFLENYINYESDDKMADEVKIFIPVFDGQDYPMWRKRIEMYLKMKECEKVIEKERPEGEAEAAWKKLEVKAMNYIYSAISNKQLEFVCDEATPKKVMDKFDKMYLRESTALQICVRNQLESLKLSEFTDSTEFFSSFEKLVIDLKNAGATVSEKEKLNYMLRSLPSEMSHVGDIIDALKTEDQTVEFVMNKIKMSERQNKDNVKRNSANAFKIERKRNGTCNGCGKFGHYKFECRSQGLT